jgi:hypothetical protein
MGAQESFQNRQIEGVTEPMRQYINLCLMNYQRNVGCDTISLWGIVYDELMKKLDTDTFKEIQTLDPIIQRGLLMESFGFTFYPIAQHDPGYVNSIKLLEHWTACGLIEKIQKLSQDTHFNEVLHFESMKRSGTSLILLFKNDEKISMKLTC